MILAKRPGCARGVYATENFEWVLECVRGAWFLKPVGKKSEWQWTGSIADALPAAQKWLDENVSGDAAERLKIARKFTRGGDR